MVCYSCLKLVPHGMHKPNEVRIFFSTILDGRVAVRFIRGVHVAFFRSVWGQTVFASVWRTLLLSSIASFC